jgi:signal transduction histidine kinase
MLRTMRIRAPGVRWLTGLPPLVADTALAAVVAVTVCVAGAEYDPPGYPRFDGLAYVLSCLVSLPLAVRRRWPVAVLAATCSAYSAYLADGNVPSANVWAPLIALYTVAARRPPRVAAGGAVAVAAAILYGGLGMLPLDLAVAEAVLVTGVVCVFGSGARRLGERNARLAELTRQLHEQQEDRERQAVIGERVRIARELHDVVAHHMSVVSVQAGLARYVLTSDPATAGDALDTIAATSTEALAEMRRLLAVLRIPPDAGDDTLAYAPAPGLARLEELLARVRAVGVAVDLAVTGEPRPLAPGVDQCVYRVVQESLTNVLKHAASAAVTMTVHFGAGEIAVRIVNDGPAVPPAPGAAGHGLMGMAERARLYGGTLAAGPRQEGGFEVALTLPTPTPTLTPTPTVRDVPR